MPVKRSFIDGSRIGVYEKQHHARSVTHQQPKSKGFANAQYRCRCACFGNGNIMVACM